MRQLLYLMAFLTFAACGASASEEKELLRFVVTNYMESERASDWNTVYSLRRKEFKDVVPFSSFESHMKRETAEFPLVRYEIEEIQTDGESASVVLSTTVEPNSVGFEKMLSKFPAAVKRVRSKAVLQWQKEEGSWVLVDGNRAFRALETRLTYEP